MKASPGFEEHGKETVAKAGTVLQRERVVVGRRHCSSIDCERTPAQLLLTEELQWALLRIVDKKCYLR